MIGDKRNITICIYFKLTNKDEWNSFSILPDKYFDLDEDEEPEIDSVPLYNHAVDYIKGYSTKIIATKIVIKDTMNNSSRIINTSYWNGQKNSIIERIDFIKENYDSEIILESQIQEVPSVYEIIRIIRKDDILEPIYHGFIEDKDDGSQSEMQIV